MSDDMTRSRKKCHGGVWLPKSALSTYVLGLRTTPVGSRLTSAAHTVRFITVLDAGGALLPQGVYYGFEFHGYADVFRTVQGNGVTRSLTCCAICWVAAAQLARLG